MAGEVIPAAVAAGGGSALAAGIYLYERRREETMRASRTRLHVRFPLGLESRAAEAALTALSGLPDHVELIAETVAGANGIEHALYVPAAVERSATAALTSTMPGLRLNPSEPAFAASATFSVRYFVPTPTFLLTEEPELAARSLLMGLAQLRRDEEVVVRWALRTTSAPRWTPPGKQPSPEQRTRLRAWHHKRAGAGFGAAGIVLVRAASMARARELAHHLTHAIEARRAGSSLRATSDRNRRNLSVMPRTNRASGWLTPAEVLPLLGWPLGDEVAPGVEVGASRELLVPRGVPHLGRRLFIGRDGSGDRPVALTPEAARHHMAIVGPSGVGKSALLARGVLSDLAAGFGGALIDPKADLIETVLDRVPDRDADRVVVLDPAVRSQAIGIDVLGTGDPDLRADLLVGVMQSLFRDSWGIRSELYLRLGLRSLAGIPGVTLADIGRLFTDTGFRTQVVTTLEDPFMVSQWQAFESLSIAEQAQHVQSPMAKLIALIGRPAVRAVLASADPKLDVAALLEERKWLLVSLAPGTLGEPASRLLGAVVLYVIWSAVEARTALPPARRRPLFLYVDELASLSALPFGFELLAERARGLGAGLTVAAQTLGRLPDPLRAALLGNVGTLVTFRAGADEALRLSRELPGLTVRDIQSLGRFEVAARIGTGAGSAVAVVTGRTEPLPAVTGNATRIRTRSLATFGATPPAPRSTAAAEAAEPPPPGRAGRTRRRP
jgi:hypothetical protein